MTPRSPGTRVRMPSAERKVTALEPRRVAVMAADRVVTTMWDGLASVADA